MVPEIWKPDHLRSGQMAAILSKKHLKSGLKNLDFNGKWSGFLKGLDYIYSHSAKFRPFEIWPSKSLDFKWSGFFLNGRNMFIRNLFRYLALFECCTFLVCYSNGLYKMAVICLFTIQKWNAIKFKCFCYSGDLNIDHLNTGNICITNFLQFGFQMVHYSNGPFWILD